MMGSTRPKVILRLGSHAEKEYFLKTINVWDGLIVGANLLEAAPGATCSLIFKFAGKKNRTPYYVDPMTYAFGTLIEKGVTQTDLDWIKSDQSVRVSAKPGQPKKRIERRYKRSYRKLAEELSGPVLEAIESNTGIVTLDDNRVQEICETVVRYQERRVRREFEADPEYTTVADLIPPPAAVFAPYFFIDPNRADDGLRLFSQCAKSAARVRSDIPIHAVFCTDAVMLGEPEFLRFAALQIKDSGVAGVWLWFSRFYEEAAELQQLRSFREFVENLQHEVEVYNMHGGYFSLALSRFGLNGVSHGIGYGEQKDVFPVIGRSTPTVRYYLPDLRRRLGVPQIERALSGIGVDTATKFFDRVCGCAICNGVIQTNIKQFSAFGDLHYSTERSMRLAQTPAAARRCRFHFLLNRRLERMHVAKLSATEIANEFNRAYEKWNKEPTIQRYSEHLARWESVLRAQPLDSRDWESPNPSTLR